ncbi:MAG: pilus assembly protein [Mesorhizobium sp.]|nr:pilus assembly protein [Mesorhizobium sp. M2A.F.Ca.ET.015.02.1.1]RVC92858.1 pilus assembly protein [Mesorhizobium sp. M2A.F.Ca.ET.017.03.2.1]RVD11429.1 pilus assembly protein [Mesorhizobium sp. M2A.F.Ca.ET.029.05.1.1]RWB49054.1 MAG: pilus assembly protein [Mesorhizobium sp.]RWB64361.1 MAG: pilus assembly protein [Mesorhizobium sp.]
MESRVMLGTIREFWRDQRGIAMILVSIMIPALIGFSVLAVDLTRANALHNDLQKGADAFALATAGELDGRSDSITRADRALANLITGNKYQFASGAEVATILSSAGVSRRYLRSLPASDDTPIRDDVDVITDEIGDAKSAIFVEVTVTPVGFDAIFPVSILQGGGSGSFDVGATAVAGFSQSICETVPIFMCNPFEDAVTPANSKTIQQAFAAGDTYSREFRILKVDSNPGPGNFGLLDNGLNSIQDGMARGTAGTCYSRNSLTSKTGVTFGQVNTGLNVRFDLYQGSLKNNSDLGYRPASNVRKGASKTSNCNKYDVASDGPPPSAMALPPGTPFDNAKGMSAPISSNSFWDSYWSINHGTAYPGSAVNSLTNPTGDLTRPASRYDVYMYEIANDKVKDQSPAPSKEKGTPSCFKGDLTKADPSRRLINLAIIDCNANQDKLNGHTAVRPDGYASVFLISPVQKQNPADENNPEGTGAEKPISLEIVDVDGPLGNGTLDKALRNEVQLYR